MTPTTSAEHIIFTQHRVRHKVQYRIVRRLCADYMYVVHYVLKYHSSTQYLYWKAHYWTAWATVRATVGYGVQYYEN